MTGDGEAAAVAWLTGDGKGTAEKADNLVDVGEAQPFVAAGEARTCRDG
jgi:hypothetical protein